MGDKELETIIKLYRKGLEDIVENCDLEFNPVQCEKMRQVIEYFEKLGGTVSVKKDWNAYIDITMESLAVMLDGVHEFCEQIEKSSIFEIHAQENGKFLISLNINDVLLIKRKL